jgi:hypothetical protein
MDNSILTIKCEKCGKEYSFSDYKIIPMISETEKCSKCDFLFLKELGKGILSTRFVLEHMPGAREAQKKGEFTEYLNDGQEALKKGEFKTKFLREQINKKENGN